MAHHIHTNEKYYLFSIIFHIIIFTLIAVVYPVKVNHSPAQIGQEKFIKVSLGKNRTDAKTNKNIFKQDIKKNENSKIEKNIYNSNEKQNSSLTKDYSENSENNILQENQNNYSSGFFKKAYLLSDIKPDYPSYAVKKGIEGTVLIDVNIDSLGNVLKADVVVSSNYDILDKAAVKCVKKAKFAPANYLGNPVSDIIRVAINFYLDKNFTHQSL